MSKLYYGDMATFKKREPYENHFGHRGIIIGTLIHTKDNTTSYEFECECGDILHPKSWDLKIVKERYISSEETSIDRNRIRFLSALSINTYNDTEKTISKVLSVLPKHYKSFIIDRYGLNPDSPVCKTQKFIGDKLGVTRQRSQQIEKLSMKKLKESNITKGYQDEGISNTQTEQE